jgi:hypothetical protein
MNLKQITSENLGKFLEFATRHFNYSYEMIDSYDELTDAEKELITESEFYELFTETVSEELRAFREARTVKIYL